MMPPIGITTENRSPDDAQCTSGTHAGRARRGPPASPSYQAVAVAASVMPSASSQRSASMAALQPSAAAVTAWR